MPNVARLKAAARDFAETRARHLPAARQLRFELAAEALERFAGGRPLNVLDAGCGDGLLAEALARRHPDWKIVAADLDDRQLQKGRHRVESVGIGNVAFVHVDLTKEPVDGAYDAVVAMECLVEISNDDAALACMVRALKPGGLFLAHVPARNWSPVLAGSDPVWRYEVRHGYHAGELDSKLKRSGLTVETLAPTTRALVRLAQEMRDRLKNRSLKLLVLVYPWSVAAVRLERWGLGCGHPRAFFVEARRR